MGVLMTLTYDELAGATTFMADQLLATQDQVHDLTQQLVAAHLQVATLQGALEVEQQRRGELRNRDDHWQVAPAEAPPSSAPLPVPPPAPRRGRRPRPRSLRS